MASKRVADRLDALEVRAGRRQHVGVILYRNGDDVEALVAAAPCAGGHGVLLLPDDSTSCEEWEREHNAPR
jgi:hypothetical protein